MAGDFIDNVKMKNCLIIHNSRCSKSRATLDLLKSHGYEPTIIDYLNGELTLELVNRVVKALNIHPKELLRTKEEEFKGLSINLESPLAVIEAILKHPTLLERPIVMLGEKAAIGRPPENVLTIL